MTDAYLGTHVRRKSAATSGVGTVDAPLLACLLGSRLVVNIQSPAMDQPAQRPPKRSDDRVILQFVSPASFRSRLPTLAAHRAKGL